jgi:hypothetical protein
MQKRNITSPYYLSIFQNSPATKFTKTKAQNMRIKDEMKFLYTTKKI